MAIVGIVMPAGSLVVARTRVPLGCLVDRLGVGRMTMLGLSGNDAHSTGMRIRYNK